MALVVAVVALAYGTQPPSLGVAEFAPAARQALDAPPTTASADVATGDKSGRRPTTSTTATTAPAASPESGVTSAAPTTRVGRSRQCYGNPPRALPDPRSSACIPTVFEGDNGGRTAKGVTETEIRVAWPFNSAYNGFYGDQWKPAVQALFDYVNRHFELYGRRLVPVIKEHASLNDVPQHRAFAAEIGALDVFAALDETVGNSALPVLYNELARQGVVTMMWGAWQGGLSERDLMDPAHPYLWSVYPAWEQISTQLADFICTSLVNRPAAHGGASVIDKTRKFGIVAAGRYRLPSVRTLLEGLAACGVAPQVVEAPDQGSGATDAFRNGAERLRSDGVTTMICACVDHTARMLIPTLKGVWEDPEWLLPLLTMSSVEEAHVRGFGVAQRAHLFGLQPHPKALPVQTQQWFGAVTEINPAAILPNTYYMAPIYEELLMLAAGIQGAGPNLTPDTFGQAMLAPGLFANAETGQAPDWLPGVGFGPGDHSFYNDFALAWWSDQAPASGQDAGITTGSWCYLDRGARFKAGTFPANADSRFFAEQPCR